MMFIDFFKDFITASLNKKQTISYYLHVVQNYQQNASQSFFFFLQLSAGTAKSMFYFVPNKP